MVDDAEGVPVLGTRGEREWRIKKIVAGYRLMFRDKGERSWTNAGVFKQAEKAERQARLG